MGEPFRGCHQVPVHEVPDNVHGRLTFDSCLLEDRFVAYHQVHIAVPREVTLQLTAPEFGERLMVFDRATGDLVATALYAGDGLGARIHAAVQPGTYVIAVTTETPGDTGDFVFTMQ